VDIFIPLKQYPYVKLSSWCQAGIQIRHAWRMADINHNLSSGLTPYYQFTINEQNYSITKTILKIRKD
jgi:hypothetical protein